MLVLARHKGEKIVIEKGRIEIVVCEILDNKVRLGIQAPREVAIDRGEIYLAKQKAKGETA